MLCPLLTTHYSHWRLGLAILPAPLQPRTRVPCARLASSCLSDVWRLDIRYLYLVLASLCKTMIHITTITQRLMSGQVVCTGRSCQYIVGDSWSPARRPLTPCLWPGWCEAAGGLRDAAAGAMFRCYAVASVVTSSAKPAAVPRAPGDPDCNYHHHHQPGVVEGETWSSFVSHSADTQPHTFASLGK